MSQDFLVFQFEAVSIQEYIFATSKLKEMVGASQLLEKLTLDVLTKAVNTAGMTEKKVNDFNGSVSKNQIYFPRKSGGVFLAVMLNCEKSHAFIQAWSLIVQQFMPGLKFSVASASANKISEGIKLVREKLDAEKNTPKISLPELTPIAQRSQRTGGEVVYIERKKGKVTPVDLATRKKQMAQNKAADFFDEVTQKWSKEKATVFPNIFEHDKVTEKDAHIFPFSGQAGEHYIAVVHADGNGLGQYIKDFMIKLGEKDDKTFIQSYAQFSQGMDNASEAAAQAATAWLISAHERDKNTALPIRPLILSGDDVACIIRADYAFEYIQRFTQEFEKASEKELSKLKTDAFPKYLTMTSGVVFLRSNQPFYMAYQLAEDLCTHSKTIGRRKTFKVDGKDMIPSTMTFNYVTNTLFEEAEQQIQQELSTTNGTKLTQEYYLLSNKDEQQEKSVNFNQLKKLSSCFDGETLKISFIRELLTYLHRDPNHAQRMLNRWIERLEKDSKQKELNQFEQALKPFGLTLENLLQNHNPLADLIAYHSLAGNFEEIK